MEAFHSIGTAWQPVSLARIRGTIYGRCLELVNNVEEEETVPTLLLCYQRPMRILVSHPQPAYYYQPCFVRTQVVLAEEIAV